MCCLRPGIPGLSDTITVRSIVGEFLEHSRIYAFGSRTSPDEARIFIGSADPMERNLDRRIEAITPIYDNHLKERLLSLLDETFKDDTNTWILGPDRRWRRLTATTNFNVQSFLKEEALSAARNSKER
jgi:polyphosphate kinase